MDAKRTKYDPIGGFLCAETAMIQAAQSLDIAAYLAAEARDAETLLRIGVAWTEVATNLSSGGSPDEDQELEDPKTDNAKRIVGFTGSGNTIGRVEGTDDTAPSDG